MQLMCTLTFFTFNLLYTLYEFCIESNISVLLTSFYIFRNFFIHRHCSNMLKTVSAFRQMMCLQFIKVTNEYFVALE